MVMILTIIFLNTNYTKCKNKGDKMKQEILSQDYMTAEDLKKLIPTMGRANCTKEIKKLIDELEAKGYYIPKTKPYIVPTEEVIKKFHIKKGT